MVAEVTISFRSGRRGSRRLTQQKVDIETALVRFIDDDRVVALEQRIALRFGEQDAIGHQLDVGIRRHLVRETYLVSHGLAERAIQFLRDAGGYGAGGNTPRLCVPDQAVDAALKFQADFRQLRGFARAGLAADYDDLVVVDSARDFRPHRHHGQLVRVGWHRQIGKP